MTRRMPPLAVLIILTFFIASPVFAQTDEITEQINNTVTAFIEALESGNTATVSRLCSGEINPSIFSDDEVRRIAGMDITNWQQYMYYLTVWSGHNIKAFQGNNNGTTIKINEYTFSQTFRPNRSFYTPPAHYSDITDKIYFTHVLLTYTITYEDGTVYTLREAFEIDCVIKNNTCKIIGFMRTPEFNNALYSTYDWYNISALGIKRLIL